MSKSTLYFGRMVTPDAVIEPGALELDSGKITQVYHVAQRCQCGLPHLKSVAAQECEAYEPDATACPGFIDIHCHGAHGHDMMDGTEQAIRGMSEFLASRGVTSFMPATVTAPWPAVIKAVKVASEAGGLPGAQVLGVHLEGPYINPKFKGAQPPEYVRGPSVSEMRSHLGEMLRSVRIVTLAPEMPGALELITFCVENGIRVSMGHSDATLEQALAGVSAGATNVSHTFNAMRPFHHREPGIVGCALTVDDLYCELIWDNLHVHSAAAEVLIRARGPLRVALVSDSMSATGLPYGEYSLGGQAVHVRGSSARLADGTLAGSVITIDTAFRNAVRHGVSIQSAAAMASAVPAQACGVGERKGRLAAGFDADITILDAALRVTGCLVAGKRVA